MNTEIGTLFVLFTSVLTAFSMSGFSQIDLNAAPPLIDEVTDQIRWNDWNPESFQKAENEGKAVLVSIEVRWQYESQKFRMEAYQKGGLAEKINSRFVPIRVDADQRPDLVRRYVPNQLPCVLFLDSKGMLLRDTKTGELYGGSVSDPEILESWCDRITNYLIAPGRIRNLAQAMPEPWSPAMGNTDVFNDAIVRGIIKQKMTRYDPEYGGFGDAEKFYQPKRPEPATLKLFLTASQLWGDPSLLTPVAQTLQKIRSGNFYQKGFGEMAEYRTWTRSNTEKTLITNMALLELYLLMHRETQDNRFMEPVYKLMDEGNYFQDIFLRKGFSGAFYSAQRAMVRWDYERGLEEGPMIQSIITPWTTQAIHSYFLLAEATRDPNWKKKALKALQFMLTEMVHENGRVAYSLDRSGPGVDTLFAAQPAMAGILLEAYQRTSEKRYLEQAEQLMQVAHEVYWQSRGYFSDVVVDQDSIGLLKQSRLDLDANAKAAQALIQLSVLTGKKEYETRAKQVLAELALEAEKKGTEAAEFAISVLFTIHPPIHAVVVGGRTHTKTVALRDRALSLNDPRILVEVVDPKEDSERLAALGYSEEKEPVLILCYEAHQSIPVSDPIKVPQALKELKD